MRSLIFNLFIVYSIFVSKAFGLSCLLDIQCPPPDDCHVGVCLGGTCGSTIALNGLACTLSSNPCQYNTVCNSGVCGGGSTWTCAAQVCNSWTCNPATLNPVVLGLGAPTCAYSPISGSCVDNDPCNIGDYCSAGACVSGTTPLCTRTACQASSCQKYLNGTAYCTAPVNLDGASCDDGKSCTVSDTCSGGVCVSGPVSCDDSNSCTTDSCSLSGACQRSVICSDVRGLGSSSTGALGITSTFDVATPTSVNGLASKNVKAITSRHYHTLIATTDDYIYGTGANEQFQLSSAVVGYANSFQAINSSLGTVLALAAGENHSLALTRSVGGSVQLYGWGSNKQKQLGLGSGVTAMTISNPTVVPFSASLLTVGGVVYDLIAMDGGSQHSVAVTKQAVYAWGMCDKNQCGYLVGGSPPSGAVSSPTLVPITGLFSILLGPIDNITGITSSNRGNILWTGNGRVYAWGNNYDGELTGTVRTPINTPTVLTWFTDPAFNPTPLAIASVSLGYTHSIWLTTTGKVYVCGLGNFGPSYVGVTINPPMQIGTPNTITGVSAGYGHSLLWSGTVLTWLGLHNGVYSAANGTAITPWPLSSTPVVDAAAGWDFSHVVSQSF